MVKWLKMRYLVMVFSLSLYVNKADSTAAKENVRGNKGGYTIYSEVMGDKEITFIGQASMPLLNELLQGITFLK